MPSREHTRRRRPENRKRASERQRVRYQLKGKRGICSVCGGPRSYQPKSGSLPEGVGRCRSCRRAARQTRDDQLKAARTKPCAICENVFEATHASAKYCSDECRDVGYKAHGRRGRRDPRSANERGYGAAHRRERKRQLDELIPGTLCPLCNEPMFLDQELDLDHSDSVVKMRGGPGDRLTHAPCNRRQGARRARGCDCEVCTGEFAALEGQCCVRSKRYVAMTISSRPKPERVFPSPVPIYIKDCVVCGKTFTAHGKGTSGELRKQCGRHTASETVLAQYHADPQYRTRVIDRAMQRYHDKGSSRKPKVLQHV